MVIDALYSKDMAAWYDWLYCDAKATKKQIQFLTKLFKKHKVKSVLDVGCGTGRHTIELKKLGYQVVGVDLEPAMISYAKKRAREERVTIPFKVQDMRKINVNEKFDAAIVLFTAFSYLETNEDVIKSLKAIHKHLKKNGLLIIENLCGWSIIASGKFKSKIVDNVKKGDKYYQIINENSVDITNNYMYTKATHLRKIGKKKLKVVKDKKPVKLRLYFPNELDLFFQMTGFQTVQYYGDIDGHKLSPKHHKRLICMAKKI